MPVSRRPRADTRLRVRPHWRTRQRAWARLGVVCFFSSLAWVVAHTGGYTAGAGLIVLTLVPLSALAVIALSTLRTESGRLIARRGSVFWASKSGAPIRCSDWVRFPGLVGFRGSGGRRHWVFRDEMSADHWRRLRLLARFSSQNGVGGSR